MAIRFSGPLATRACGRLIAAGLLACAVTGVASVAALAETTPWQNGHHVQTRLVTGGELNGDGLRRIVAVHMKLDAGWKTYWRNPGTSGGIPPSFDLSRSTNVASFTVNYPTPNRYVDETGTTFGFKTEVMFPIDVIPRDPSRPIELRLNAFFGVCEEICIPVDLSLSHSLAPSAFNTLTPQLADALARVPRNLNSADDATRKASAHVVVVEPELGGEKPHLVVYARENATTAVRDVLSVPHGDVFMGLPKRLGVVTRADGPAVAYRLPLMSKGDATRLRGGAVDIIVIGENGATSQTFQVPR